MFVAFFCQMQQLRLDDLLQYQNDMRPDPVLAELKTLNSQVQFLTRAILDSNDVVHTKFNEVLHHLEVISDVQY